MFTGPDWLKAHKGDLHGEDQADDVEGTVGWREKSIRAVRLMTIDIYTCEHIRLTHYYMLILLKPDLTTKHRW